MSFGSHCALQARRVEARKPLRRNKQVYVSVTYGIFHKLCTKKEENGAGQHAVYENEDPYEFRRASVLKTHHYGLLDGEPQVQSNRGSRAKHLCR